MDASIITHTAESISARKHPARANVRLGALVSSLGNRIADAVPDLILKSDQRWRR
jgi:hypothetical protein